jgi:hypothetical protein
LKETAEGDDALLIRLASMIVDDFDAAALRAEGHADAAIERGAGLGCSDGDEDVWNPWGCGCITHVPDDLGEGADGRSRSLAL